jgi:hypothetical protein
MGMDAMLFGSRTADSICVSQEPRELLAGVRRITGFEEQFGKVRPYHHGIGSFQNMGLQVLDGALFITGLQLVGCMFEMIAVIQWHCRSGFALYRSRGQATDHGNEGSGQQEKPKPMHGQLGGIEGFCGLYRSVRSSCRT